jgi:hypothetical protein
MKLPIAILIFAYAYSVILSAAKNLSVIKRPFASLRVTGMRSYLCRCV